MSLSYEDPQLSETCDLYRRIDELTAERDKAQQCAVTLTLERDALREQLEFMLLDMPHRERDARRLQWLPHLLDVIGGFDIHEEAMLLASAFGRAEPNGDDYLAAVRTGIDAAMCAIDPDAALEGK